MFSSPLQRAIEKGMKPGNCIGKELYYLERYPIVLREDAKAICKALSRLPSPPEIAANESSWSPIEQLASWFLEVNDVETPAYDVLYHEGLPQLLRLADEVRANPAKYEADVLFRMLRVLALFGSLEGAEKVAECASASLYSTDFWWHTIIEPFSWSHPHQRYLFHVLSDPLPQGDIALALLNSANQVGNRGELSHHPFDNKGGWKQLEHWLTSSDYEDPRNARSAVEALPFISNPPRDKLLQVGLDYDNPKVQLEAALVAARQGLDVGVTMLRQFCLDVHHASIAQHYLALLGKIEEIPVESLDPSFEAKSELSQMLSRGADKLIPPEVLEVVDHRILCWPPERIEHPFWMIRYRIPDANGLKNDCVDYALVGAGDVGSPRYDLHRRPLDDGFAICCYLKLYYDDLIKSQDDVEYSSEYDGMLSQWKGESLEDAEVTHVIELSAALKYPTGLVAAATAKLNGVVGWVVLDGPRSCWYPAADFPEERTMQCMVLMVHVGRHLLGLHDSPDRQKYLSDVPSGPTSAQVCQNYEAFLQEFETATPDRQENLLSHYGALGENFDTYVKAYASVNSVAASVAFAFAYQRLLYLIENSDESVREKLIGMSGIPRDKFLDYVSALIEQGRVADVVKVVERMTPWWEDRQGIAWLGEALYKVHQYEQAKAYFLKLIDSSGAHNGSEQIGMLAEILHKRGETERARTLLLESMNLTAAQTRKKLPFKSMWQAYADMFYQHRAAYLRFFPGDEAELAKLGIPEKIRRIKTQPSEGLD